MGLGSAFFWPGLLCLLGAARVGRAGAGCELEGWVSDQAAPGGGEDGYHVLCVLDASVALVYQGGVASEAPLRVTLDGDGGDALRASLGGVLRFGETIQYEVQGKPPMKWKRRPWALFTAKGQQLPVGKEAALLAKAFQSRRRPMTLLLFEGGAWRWPTIRVGYERPVMRGIKLTTVARQPALFEVVIDRDRATAADGGGEGEEQLSRGLLSDVVEVAKPQLAKQQNSGGVRTSQQAFLEYDRDPKLQTLREGTALLARVPEENLESLQVVRYSTDQFYDAHRDYWDPREFPNPKQFTDRDGYWNQRHATLLWYLQMPEAGGQTWFPRASGGPIPYGAWLACDGRGASVHPTNASAVLFYNLKADGDIDEFSWHSGCPVTAGVKWAANSWIHNGFWQPVRAGKPRRRRKREL